MKKKKFYTILSKITRHIYGAFERNKEGLLQAKKYKEKLKKETKIDFIIK
jgi:hypothetical protein